MSNTIILVTVISSALLSPFLSYLYSSRCHRIKCACIECDRTIVHDDKSDYPKPQTQHQEPQQHNDQF
jgi:hypothetical protein